MSDVVQSTNELIRPMFLLLFWLLVFTAFCSREAGTLVVWSAQRKKQLLHTDKYGKYSIHVGSSDTSNRLIISHTFLDIECIDVITVAVRQLNQNKIHNECFHFQSEVWRIASPMHHCQVFKAFCLARLDCGSKPHDVLSFCCWWVLETQGIYV